MSAEMALVSSVHDKPFALYDGKIIFVERYLRDIYALASRLESGPVINYCENRYLFTVVLGAALLNGVASLLPPNRTIKTVQSICETYKPSNIVHDGFFAATGDIFPNVKTIDIKSFLAGPVACAEKLVTPMIREEQVAVIAFTSGTTGDPKPNKKQWGSLATTAIQLRDRLLKGNGDGSAIVATVPPQHMFGLEMSVLVPLQSDALLMDRQPFYPADISELFSRKAFLFDAGSSSEFSVVLVSTPVHLDALIKSNQPLETLDSVVSATAPLSAKAVGEFWDTYNKEIFEIYGFTEAGSVATRLSRREPEWLPLARFSCVIENGIVNSFYDNYLKAQHEVSDVIEVAGEGKFVLCGRSGDMLNIGGKRHSLAGLNEIMNGLPEVEDAVVLQREDVVKRGVMALVVSEFGEEQILSQFSAYVDPLFVPKLLIKVNKIPRNSVGKVLASELEKIISSSV